jgi:glycosyltransferase involved in cell wall biosynthesis
MHDLVEPVKLSVLVVSYNHEKYIGEALDSILAQQVDFPIEIIAADDCSTDRTAEILRQYQARYPERIKILDASLNVGITRNYQRGFAACRGEYVAVLEGDDIWLGKDRLAILAGFLDEHPECVLVFNRILLNESSIQHCRPLQWDSAQPFELKTGDDLAYSNFIGNFSACLFRACAVNRLDPRIYELRMYDWLFNLSLSRFGLIGYLPRILSVYRQHSEGSWAGMDMEKKLSDTAALIPVYDQFLDGVYSANFNAHLAVLNLHLENARLARQMQEHRHNPLIVGYILLLKVIRRVKIKTRSLLGR